MIYINLVSGKSIECDNIFQAWRYFGTCKNIVNIKKFLKNYCNNK